MFGYQTILTRLDLEIAAAGAREMVLESIELSDEDYRDFCTAVKFKETRFAPWPQYRGLKITRKQKK